MEAGEPKSQPLVSAAPLQPRSRFLKQEAGSGSARQGAAGRGGLRCAAGPGPGLPRRASTVLRRLAQIESQIQRRKAGLGTGGSAAPQTLTEGELFRSQSSREPEGGAGGPRCLQAETRPKEAPGPGSNTPPGNRASLDREEEDASRRRGAASRRQRQESIFPPSPGRKPTRTLPPPPPPSKKSSPPGGSSLKRLPHRAPSTASWNTPVRSGGTSLSLPSPINDTLAGEASSNMNGRSLSEESVIRSLDELFLGAANSQGSSSSDFQVNVFSLADLAPSMASQKEGLTGEATVIEISGSLSTEPKLFFANTHSAFKPPNTIVGKAAALEEDLGETEISEQLSGSSVEHSNGKQEAPISAHYSEDFESLSGDTERQSSSSEDGSVASLQSGLSDPSPPCPPKTGTRRSWSARRITAKEAAVQTNNSSLIPLGLKTAATTIGWIVEGPPTASHVVSMDALEELTTHRPAVSALNDMLKQNLLLIQQFVETCRHLHLSFVALLEEEEFHYHTLEEAKTYIDHHKRPPMTLEQVLHELKEQKQVAT